MRVERSPFNPDSSLGRSRESMATSTSGTFEEEKKGVIKSGIMQGGFTPFKGKGKSMYVVLSERAIEIYENEKAYIKKRPSKHTIDLAIAFNVHNDHYDPKLNKCVCVMRPDDTLLLKAENEQMNQEWFESILATAVPARALRLGRFATPQEFFEAAYDVTIVDTPKKQGHSKEDDESILPNIIEKHPHLEGPRRLCFYAHTIFLCLKNIEPGKEEDLNNSGIPPFKAVHAYEIQRKFIPSFGFRDHYFVLVMGRGSPMGSCELWAECDSTKVAEHIHHCLNGIIEREANKKKRMINGTPQPTPSMPTINARGHRERSHTQPHRTRLASEILARSTHSPLAALARKSSTGTVSGTSSRTQPTKLGEPSSSASPLAASNGTLPVPGLRHSFAAPSEVKGNLIPHSSVFPARRQSETIKEEASTYQPMDPRDEARKKEWEQIMRGEVKGCRAVSPSTTRSSTDETEDSGGTLRCYGDTEDSGGTLKMGVDSRPQSRDGSIRNLSLVKHAPIKKGEKASSSDDDADAPDADIISAGTNTSTGGESISTGGELADFDYTHMEVVQWNGENSNLSVPMYNPNAPRSLVSSSDSCYSSIAERERLQSVKAGSAKDSQQSAQIRSNSFGPGHHSIQRPKNMIMSSAIEAARGPSTGTKPNSGGREGANDAANEEARKRAYSLGHNFGNLISTITKPFRKGRGRGSATSASGASLSSTASSGGAPPSNMPMTYMGGDRNEEYKNSRSGSFGSGRSTPYSRRSGPVDANTDHLMEMDFGGPSGHHGLGRCGSGSMGSVDSPSRSRTSSFGCNVRRNGEDREEETVMTPSQILLAKAKQQSIDDKPHDSSDYVVTEAPSASAPRYHHGHHHENGIPPPPPAVQHTYSGIVLDVMNKVHDSRSSQFFETIEETTSGRSSRASSIGDRERMMAEVPKEEEEDDYTEMEMKKNEMKRLLESKKEDDDEYTEMEVGGRSDVSASTHPLLPSPVSQQQQQRRSHSPSPSSRIDSTSTLHSMASSSDRSDRENKETSPSSAPLDSKMAQQQQKQALRQKISTKSEGPSSVLLSAPAGLPKRASVPVLKEAREGEGEAASTPQVALNYACIQVNGTAHDSRARSKSGILFPSSPKEAIAAENADSDTPMQCTLLKALP